MPMSCLAYRRTSGPMLRDQLSHQDPLTPPVAVGGYIEVDLVDLVRRTMDLDVGSIARRRGQGGPD